MTREEALDSYRYLDKMRNRLQSKGFLSDARHLGFVLKHLDELYQFTEEEKQQEKG